MAYTHLSFKERHYIELERKKGRLQKDIAASLGRDPSTLSRELSRNVGERNYRHSQANKMALERHRNKPKAIKMTDEIKTKISEYISQDWSPEQVAGRLKKKEALLNFKWVGRIY